MNVVKYEEDSNETEFAGNNDLLSPIESPSTSAGLFGVPEPRLNLLDGTFFSFIPQKSTANKIVASCVACRPRHVEVKGYGNCSSNFLSHLKRRHGDEAVEDYRNYIKCKRSRFSKHNDENTNRKTSSPTSRASETGVMGMTLKICKESLTPQTDYSEQFTENVFRFFISAMIPPSAVENQYFIQLLDTNTPIRILQMITQQHLEKRIKDSFTNYVADIKIKLSEMENVCTTVHVWLGEKEHFICVSAHWITQDICRYSAPLAFRGIKCKNYNAFSLSQLVREINEDFGISPSKLVGSITGNDSNFVNAFKIFGVQLTNILMSEQLDLEDCVLFDADDVNFYDETEEKAESSDIEHLDTNSTVLLKCCSKLLTTAISKAIDENLNYSNNTMLSNIHATTINKCNILWQAAGNPKLSKIIENHTSTKLKRPKFTDWTSLNISLQQILALKDKNVTLHKALNLQNPLSDAEFVYLQEYLMCTAPIVEALDILQSIQNTFFGIVMPCLFALRRNLMKVARKTQFYYCYDLINSYTVHVTSAFTDFFDLNAETAQNAAFAALSFPRFKNQWLVCVTPVQRNEILNAFKQIVAKEVNMNCLVEIQPPERNNRENDFFNFDDDLESENTKSNLQHSLDAPFRKAEVQVLQFFAEESTDLSILYSYPEIKRVFLKYNTPLPSLATGERLFHQPTMIELKRNHKTFNDLLEKRLILNANLNRNKI